MLNQSSQAGQKIVDKVYVYCPFCGNNTTRWKMINCVWEWNVNHTRLELEAVNIKEANDFERKILQDHLKKCEIKNHISDYALELYGLKND